MSHIRLRHWLVALAIAAAALAALMIRFNAQATVTSTHAGDQGVQIALAPKQGKPGSKQVAANTATENETPEQEHSISSAQASDAERSHKSRSEPKPKPNPKQQTEPSPKTQSDPESETEPDSGPKPQPDTSAEPIPEPELEPEPEPGPKPNSKREKQSEHQPQNTQTHEASAKPSESKATAKRANSAKPAGGQDDRNTAEKATQKAAQPRQGSTGSVADTPTDYQSELAAALQKHKSYPRQARRHGQEGTALLHFVMTHSGRVVRWQIKKSSGHELLDDAVRRMIQQANPLPSLPDDVGMQRMSVTIPISFKLR